MLVIIPAAVALWLLLAAHPQRADAAVDSTMTSSGGRDILNVTSDGAGDTIAVTCGAGNKVKVNGSTPSGGALDCADLDGLQISAGAGADRIDLTGVTEAVFTDLTTPKVVRAGSGNDVITSGDHLEDELLVGGPGRDRIRGGSGNDTIKGKRGNDVLKGNDGNDTLKGGRGDDRLRGGPGRDTLNGGPGDDDVQQ